MGVDIRLNQPVDVKVMAKLLEEFDAVVLAIGLGKGFALGIEGESLPGVWDALDFIFRTRTLPLTECEVGRRVLVLGAGNTAIDVATAAVRLGADKVTLAYRRGPDSMPAFDYEFELAKADGVRFEWFVQPVRVVADASGRAAGVEFVRVQPAEASSRQNAPRRFQARTSSCLPT